MDRIRRMRRTDDGLGILTAIFVMAVVSALAVTATSLTVNNLGNARRDRQSLSALATSEAGVSQALQFLRSGSLAALTCIEPSPGAAPGPSCQGTTTSWISATNPMQVNVNGTIGLCASSLDCFKVWIGTVSPYVPNCSARHATPPGSCSGVYRVHSTGLSGNGPGARKLAVDVKMTPYPFPIGVFSEQSFSGSGNVGISSESIFTAGCMQNRQNDAVSGSGVQFQWDAANNRPVIDLIYDQPASAHAAGGNVSTSNKSCGAGAGGAPIHQTSKCNTTFKYDQDAAGAALTPGDGCYGAYTRADGTSYPTSSAFSAADLQNYGYRPRGLTDAQYAALLTQAKSEGTYNLAPSSISTTLTNLAASGITSPVLFWDNGPVALQYNQIPSSFLRNLSSTANCASNSVTIVVVGPGNGLSYQGGNTAPYLVTSMFVPDGTLSGIGGFNIIGTAFAKQIDLSGGMNFYLDPCFANNPPGGTLSAQVVNWREDDSKDIN
ncbi:MAG: hypothetical protein NVS3B26_14760 [Mycobacteriales bacterium]